MERLTRRMCGGYGMAYGHELNTVQGMRDAVNRLAAYEDTGLEPQTISEILDGVSEWYDAHKEGRLVVLDDRTALAIAAGARAIRGNKRLVGSKYVYDIFGKNGGPYEISYHEASEILAAIWDAYPLPEPSGGDE